MAFTTFPFESTRIMLDYRTRQYDLDFSIQASTMEFLNTFNWNGVGHMPDFDYTVPGNLATLTYKYGNGEVQINGTPWSSCGSEPKRLFRIYQRQFVKKGLLTYSEVYGL